MCTYMPYMLTRCAPVCAYMHLYAHICTYMHMYARYAYKYTYMQTYGDHLEAILSPLAGQPVPSLGHLGANLCHLEP